MADDELDNIMNHGSEKQRFALVVQMLAMLQRKIDKLEERVRDRGLLPVEVNDGTQCRRLESERVLAGGGLFPVGHREFAVRSRAQTEGYSGR